MSGWLWLPGILRAEVNLFIWASNYGYQDDHGITKNWKKKWYVAVSTLFYTANTDYCKMAMFTSLIVTITTIKEALQVSQRLLVAFIFQLHPTFPLHSYFCLICCDMAHYTRFWIIISVLKIWKIIISIENNCIFLLTNTKKY